MEDNRLDIKVSFACNNRCKFCVQGDKRKIFKNMDASRIVEIFKQSSKKFSEVVFTGGEPTLREDIVDLVDSARSYGFKWIQIQSNGRMFAYMDFCIKMMRAGANQFSPALHGHSKKVHDFLTSSSGSFKQTVSGIENIKSLGGYVLTNTVINTFNYKDLPKIAKLFVKLGVNQFQFAFPHIAGTAYKNRNWLIPKISQVMDYVKAGLDIGKNAGLKAMTEAIPYCFMQGYEGCISENYIPDAKIFDSDFVIDNYTIYRRSKGKIKAPHCKDCVYNRVCEGTWKEYPQIFGFQEFKPRLK